MSGRDGAVSKPVKTNTPTVRDHWHHAWRVGRTSLRTNWWFQYVFLLQAVQVEYFRELADSPSLVTDSFSQCSRRARCPRCVGVPYAGLGSDVSVSAKAQWPGQWTLGRVSFYPFLDMEGMDMLMICWAQIGIGIEERWKRPFPKIGHRGQRSCGGISSDQQLGDSFTMHSSSHLAGIDDYWWLLGGCFLHRTSHNWVPLSWMFHQVIAAVAHLLSEASGWKSISFPAMVNLFWSEPQAMDMFINVIPSLWYFQIYIYIYTIYIYIYNIYIYNIYTYIYNIYIYTHTFFSITPRGPDEEIQYYTMVYLWFIYGLSMVIALGYPMFGSKLLERSLTPWRSWIGCRQEWGSPWGFCHRRAPSNTTIYNGGYILHNLCIMYLWLFMSCSPKKEGNQLARWCHWFFEANHCCGNIMRV